MLIIFLILNEIFMQSSGKTLYLFAAKEYLSVFMLQAVIFYTSSSKDLHTLLNPVWKNTPCLKMTLI